jgi:hypothetical protein
MSKGDKYSARQDVDEFDVISEKLAQDLRRSIRQLVSSFLECEPLW